MRILPIFLLLGALFAALPVPAPAQLADGTVETSALMLERWSAEATLIELRLTEDSVGIGEIDGMRAALEAQRTEIGTIRSEAETVLAPLREQLEALGAAPEDPGTEPPVISDNREKLKERAAEADARVRRSDRADARAVALLMQLAERRRAVFTQELLTRGPSVFAPGAIGRAITSIGKVAAQLRAEVATQHANSAMGLPFFVRLLLPLVMIGAALFLVIKIRRTVLTRFSRSVETDGRAKAGAFVSLKLTLVRLMMPAIALAMINFSIWNSGLLGAKGELALVGFTHAAVIVIVCYAFGASFYSPRLPTLRLSALSDAEAGAAHFWLLALAAIIGLDRILGADGNRLGLSIEALELLNAILLVSGGVALWHLISFLTHRQAEGSVSRTADDDELAYESEESGFQKYEPVLIGGVRLITRVGAVFAPMLALMGYFAASRFVFYPGVLSIAVIGACVVVFRRVRYIVDRISMDEDGEEDEKPRRIRLIPVVIGFLLSIAALPLLALIWGADPTDLSNAWRKISDGLAIGDMVISPVNFLSFLLVFSIGYLLTRLVQGVLGRSVLPLTGMDVGARDLVSAGVFYAGISLSALIAISATGLDLSSLAIVAGALTVGIGFGLQNIVNNFVSGIILLIERPIKAGDWVEITSGMGYVKRVNVRSTVIETFDRAALIVPNSELISGPVTNWTHTNLNGRVIVPVGVAYGTDPKRVETILTEIAKAHPMLLRRPMPYVLFRRFGADSLDFEIRGVLRDVNWILNVTSDINFEIARRFAEEGIEIPFAQRDLHLRNADELGESIGNALKGGQRPQAKAQKPPSTTPRRPSSPSGFAEAAGNEPDGDS